MKIFFSLFFCFFIFLFKLNSQEWKIDFLNGDSIQCNSLSFDKDTISLVTQSFENKMLKRKISDLCNIEKKSFSVTVRKSQFILFFKNSSQIACNIKEIKDKFIIAETDFAGEIKIPLSKVAEIVFLEENANQVIREVDWHNRANWQILPAKFVDNFKIIEDKILLISPVIAAIDCPLKKVKISFSSLFSYDYGISLLLFSNLKKESSEAYFFTLLPYSIRLAKISNGEQNSLGDKPLKFINTEQMEPYILNYVILADSENGSFEVIVNGKEKVKFNDPNDKKLNGNKIAFICPEYFSVISNFSISEWDGKPIDNPDEKEKLSVKNSFPEKDVILLRNNDLISGSLLQISANSINFKTDFGVLDIPVDRIKKIVLCFESSEEEKRATQENQEKEGLFEIFIGDKTKFELTPIHCDGKSLQAYSPLLDSSITINISFVKNMHSIVYASKIAKQSGSIFDEILKARLMPSIDQLDQEGIEAFEKELGDIIEFLYY